MNPSDQITYGIEDAHKQLGIARSKLYELIGTGELASLKIGRRRLITRRALTEYVARKEREGSKAA